MVRTNGRIYVVAKRDIKKGEELFISYGKKYWESYEQEVELNN